MSLVIGLDMSITSPGLAFINDGQIVWVANMKTTGKKMRSLKYPMGATTAQRHVRLKRVLSFVAKEVNVFGADNFDLAVIEGPAMGSTFGSPHDRSGLWWQVVDMLLDAGIPVTEVSPAGRAKYITGNGRAKKDGVLAHAIGRWQPNVTANRAGRIGNCDDIADAIGLADMGARHLGHPVVENMPPENLAAMDGVLW